MSQSDNLGNFQEKRRVTIAPLFSLLALILSLFMIFFPFFKDRGVEQKKLTKAKLESVAYQIAAFERRKLAQLDPMASSDRRPASVGKAEKLFYGNFGADAQGKALNYEVQQSGTHLKVSVWPAGNLKARTEVLIPNDRQ